MFKYACCDRALDLNLTLNREMLHEIVVPTCSYRMGVRDMAYGVLRIGTLRASIRIYCTLRRTSNFTSNSAIRLLTDSY